MIENLLLLNMAEGLAPVRLKALLDYFRTPEAVLAASLSELRGIGIGKKAAENILKISKDKSLIEKEMRLIKRHKVKIMTIFDEDYPFSLKQISDPPVVLYVKGRIIQEDRLSIAIVGSRRCSSYGREMALRLAGELCSFGITVVSGMARGIDTAAHKGTLRSGGRTIAVLGSGLARLYPPENEKLAQDIAFSGAVVSEFPMTAAPVSWNFPRRNRIISGLSLGTVVVEAAKDSGALITAKFAAEEGREVFSVPHQAQAVNSFGGNCLIRDGAKLVESASDILEELSLGYTQKEFTGSRKVLAENLNSQERKILDILTFHGPMHIDTIAEESPALSPALAFGTLTILETKGLIRRDAGNIFSIM